MRDTTTTPTLADLQDELSGWRAALLLSREEHAKAAIGQCFDSASAGAGMAGCFGIR